MTSHVDLGSKTGCVGTSSAESPRFFHPRTWSSARFIARGLTKPLEEYALLRKISPKLTGVKSRETVASWRSRARIASDPSKTLTGNSRGGFHCVSNFRICSAQTPGRKEVGIANAVEEDGSERAESTGAGTVSAWIVFKRCVLAKSQAASIAASATMTRKGSTGEGRVSTLCLTTRSRISCSVIPILEKTRTDWTPAVITYSFNESSTPVRAKNERNSSPVMEQFKANERTKRALAKQLPMDNRVTTHYRPPEHRSSPRGMQIAQTSWLHPVEFKSIAYVAGNTHTGLMTFLSQTQKMRHLPTHPDYPSDWWKRDQTNLKRSWMTKPVMVASQHISQR